MLRFFKTMAITCSFILIMAVFTPKVFAATMATQRLSGNNRYLTSIEVSKSGWVKSDYAVIVNGENFPDALCSAPLAKLYDAPILLNEQASLNEAVSSELTRLAVKQVFITGGQGSISSNVEDQLKAMNITVTRIAGADRFETSIQVANKMAEKLGEVNKIFLVNGENGDFADAISISTIAASKEIPIILSTKDTLPASAKTYLSKLDIVNSYIIGGVGVLSANIESQVSAPERISGNDRYLTNLAVIKKFSADYKFDSIFIASGLNFPDALSSSALGAKTASPIILVDTSVRAETTSFIKSKVTSASKLIIIGGTAVVSVSSYYNLINTVYKIVLDAGHGGSDTGAIGSVLGLKEKDINLAVTLKVGAILAADGVQVTYTRTTDAIPWPQDETANLQARVDISNKVAPDYFVCIHCNSYVDSSANGTETYTYALSTQGEVLAKAVQSELVKAIGLYDRGVSTANFYVLKYTNAPSILAELGFLSNPNEEKLLGTDAFQNKCAAAIAKGIIETLGK